MSAVPAVILCAALLTLLYLHHTFVFNSMFCQNESSRFQTRRQAVHIILPSCFHCRMRPDSVSKYFSIYNALRHGPERSQKSSRTSPDNNAIKFLVSVNANESKVSNSTVECIRILLCYSKTCGPP